MEQLAPRLAEQPEELRDRLQELPLGVQGVDTRGQRSQALAQGPDPGRPVGLVVLGHRMDGGF